MNLLPLPETAPHGLLLGYSGGRDSSALLHRLVVWCAEHRRSLRALHVHHGLHPDADVWAAHCEARATTLGVPCRVQGVLVQEQGRGLEDAARRARYAAFAAERRDDECLVLAHHRDDQAETLLLALLRGSGERGLAAMRPYLHDTRGPIWRPLLDTPANTIAAYAQEHGLDWIEDPSNADPRHSRNVLRHEVLPLLRRRWPQADAALAHSAALLAEADALLSAQAGVDLAALLGLDPSVLDLAALHTLPPERARRALMAWARTNHAALSRDAIARVFGEWRGSTPERALRNAQGPHWLRQWQGRLWLTPRSPSPAITACDWDGSAPLALADGGKLQLLGAAAFDLPLHLVPRSLALPRFRDDARRPARALQQVFAELGIPPWQRAALPLLVDAHGELQAIADLAYAAEFDNWLRERSARLLWQPGPLRPE